MNDLKKSKIVKQYFKDGKITILDIGARGGLHPRWEKISNFINLIGFEPDKKECERLNNLKWKNNTRFFPIALGEKHEDSFLYVCESPGCISILEPDDKFVDDFFYGNYLKVIGKEKLVVQPLLDICLKESIEPDFIKIDTQGTELSILKGAGKLLESVKLIELEIEFNPIYKNQPLFSDVDQYLRKQGYELLGLRRSFWRRKIPNNFRNISAKGGQIIHGDALFINARYLNSENIDVKNVFVFLLLLSVYKQDDLIIYLLTKPHKALTKITLTDRLALVRFLTTHNRNILINNIVFNNKVFKYILNKLKIPISNRQWRSFIDKLRLPNVTDWHDPDFY